MGGKNKGKKAKTPGKVSFQEPQHDTEEGDTKQKYAKTPAPSGGKSVKLNSTQKHSTSKSAQKKIQQRQKTPHPDAEGEARKNGGSWTQVDDVVAFKTPQSVMKGAGSKKAKSASKTSNTDRSRDSQASVSTVKASSNNKSTNGKTKKSRSSTGSEDQQRVQQQLFQGEESNSEEEDGLLQRYSIHENTMDIGKDGDDSSDDEDISQLWPTSKDSSQEDTSSEEEEEEESEERHEQENHSKQDVNDSWPKNLISTEAESTSEDEGGAEEEAGEHQDEEEESASDDAGEHSGSLTSSRQQNLISTEVVASSEEDQEESEESGSNSDDSESKMVSDQAPSKSNDSVHDGASNEKQLLPSDDEDEGEPSGEAKEFWSSSEDNEETDNDSEEESGDDDVEQQFLQRPKEAKGINLEKAGQELDEAEESMQQEADEDMQLHIQSSAPDTGEDTALEGEHTEDFFSSFHLPTPEELLKEEYSPPDLNAIKERMQIVTAILADFNQRRDPNRARAEYMEVLAHDLKNFYGYAPDLIDLFLRLFSPAETIHFLEANEQPRPTVIRVNTLKTRRRELAQALINRGVNVDPLAPWSKVGLKVYESAVPIGATPEYLSGHYMLQSASSFWPCIALGVKPGERILDMAAAPGGKTTYIGQLMKNKGLLVANDSKRERTHALVANLHRMGMTNSIVCNYDGTQLPNVMTGFDRVLLDAPCTGLGVISRDPSIKSQKTYPDVLRMAHLQKKLLLAAIDCADADSKTGGVVVYSTCSVSAEENEAVVDYALRKRYVKLLPLTPHAAINKKDKQPNNNNNDDKEKDKQETEDLDVGLAGLTRHQHRRFHPSLTLSRRFYPHVHNMDGFFVAKLKKFANFVRTNENGRSDSDGEEDNDQELNQDHEDSLRQESNLEESEGGMQGKKKRKSDTQSKQKSGNKQPQGKSKEKRTDRKRNKRHAENVAQSEGASKQQKTKKSKKLPSEMSAAADTDRMGNIAEEAVSTLTKKKEEAERKQQQHKSGQHLLDKFGRGTVTSSAAPKKGKKGKHAKMSS
eukprot:gb/GECG01008955.1/.p1 GENE.gb/GECG01008955.1/~~gb/GECG01008955.1/.p1  ORF type:complete len:1037 (+),score=246.51 gb/GECG01008955.1/:1-3111(+)